MNPTDPGPPAPPRGVLPPDDPQRDLLHNEVHARPPARIRLPALVIYVAVLNAGVSGEDEWEHLRRLPGQGGLDLAQMQAGFLRLRLGDCTLKWERHSEYTRYVIVQALPPSAALGDGEPDLVSALVIDPEWLREIPGRCIAAVKLAMQSADIADPGALVGQARRWFGGRPIAASLTGLGHSIAVADFALRETGFEHMLVLAPADISETRAGRIAQRLHEIETYRLMALRGLPVAKALTPALSEGESALAEITARLANKVDSDQALLDRLVSLAAQFEHASAEHLYRFSATRAYARLVDQRIGELRELPIPATQTIGEFMQRRLTPAIATVDATAQRLVSLSQRIERAGALLRTRVDIATEAQNQQLLAKLTRGQQLQLQLQSTVEGLSIAAISYYVVSLLLYAGKAAKAAGLPINPEMAAGAAIPLVLFGVARLTRRIHDKLHA